MLCSCGARSLSRSPNAHAPTLGTSLCRFKYFIDLTRCESRCHPPGRCSHRTSRLPLIARIQENCTLTSQLRVPSPTSRSVSLYGRTLPRFLPRAAISTFPCARNSRTMIISLTRSPTFIPPSATASPSGTNPGTARSRLGWDRRRDEVATLKPCVLHLDTKYHDQYLIDALTIHPELGDLPPVHASGKKFFGALQAKKGRARTPPRRSISIRWVRTSGLLVFNTKAGFVKANTMKSRTKSWDRRRRPRRRCEVLTSDLRRKP